MCRKLVFSLSLSLVFHTEQMRTSFGHFILKSTSGINQDSCAAEMRLNCLRNDFEAVGESSDACARHECGFRQVKNCQQR